MNPYRNLAIEEHLLNTVEEGECILYLWQNRHTVVIGRNQNAFAECKTEKLASDGGFLARRLSGGGSVYHDTGNLNFTFLVKERDYDVNRQLCVITRALESFSLRAEKTGRNDICIAGKKFSGNAFYSHLGRCYHHGTILLDVDLGKMSEYLQVSAEKLRSNGVSSVKSRVVNLRELNPEITVPSMKAALVRAFGEIYGSEPGAAELSEQGGMNVDALTEKYSSDEWRFGKNMKADFTAGSRFAWGGITVMLQISGETVTGAQVFSDAMDESISGVLEACLTGVRFSKETVTGALVGAEGKINTEILGDITTLLKTQEIW